MRRQIKEIAEYENLQKSLLDQRSKEMDEEINIFQPPQNKQKRCGQEYQSNNLSDEHGEAEAEIDKYLSMRINPVAVVDKPLVFCKENSTLIVQIGSNGPLYPATIERKLSAGDLIMTERRSSVHPINVDNILFLISVTQEAVF